MFLIILGLVLLFLGTWNASPFLESLEDLPMLTKSVISLGLMGGIPAIVIVFGGMIDAFIVSKRLSGK